MTAQLNSSNCVTLVTRFLSSRPNHAPYVLVLGLGDDAASPGSPEAAGLAAGADAGDALGSDDSDDEASPRSVGDIPDRRGRVHAVGHAGRRAAGPTMVRSAAVQDLSDLTPAGCTLRKYNPDSGSAYWLGVLPAAQQDTVGRHSRRLTWGLYTSRSEAETLSLIQAWLSEHAT